jgi:hypothetical protein
MNLKALLLLILLSLPAFPWGKVGHQTIAYIAEQNLDSLTLAKIKPLLSGESIEDVSIWADQYKTNHRNTGPWHYINLPVRQNLSVKDVARFETSGKPGANLISQINEDIALLKSGKGSFSEKQTALWFLIHFIGDLHMPLHVGEDSDRGGNGKPVRYFSPTSSSNKGHVTNLHSLWDNLVEVKAAEDPAELGAELNRKITDTEKVAWKSGTIEDWAVESYTVSKNTIYVGFSAGATETAVPLAKDYHSKMRPVCDEQIEKAGVRLAYVLEQVLGQ